MRGTSPPVAGRVRGTTRGSIGHRVAKQNRPVDPGARRVAGQSSEDCASRCVDDRLNSPPLCRKFLPCPPTVFGRMVELPQLRASERIGVRGRCHCGQSGSSGGTRVCEDGCIRAPMNGQAKSSLMSVLIDQADAKRRCIEATQTDGSQV